MAKKTYKPNIIRGGVAKPLGANYYLFTGRKHSEGGIDIGKDLEVEDGEIAKVTKNGMKIVSAVPIMNGISPAQYTLGGLRDGSLERRFNESFKYQEKYKDKKGLNDDGTKAQMGKDKEFKLGDVPILYEKEKDPKVVEVQKLLEKTYPDNYVELVRKYPDLLDLTDDINIGKAYLYTPGNNYVRDKETNMVYLDVAPDTPLNSGNFEQLPYKQLREMLPDRDYIGGTNVEVRNKVWEKIPSVTNAILDIAKRYSIDSNIIKHRLNKEGLIDKLATLYNDADATSQKHYFDGVLNEQFDPFVTLGLDHAGSLLEQNKLKLLKDVYWSIYNTGNEKGEKVKSVHTDNLSDSLEILGAQIKYLQDIARSRGIPEDQLSTYINAMYNLGPNHTDLNETDWINKNYTVPKYFKLGGETNMKQTKRNNSSTGGRTKAFDGGNYLGTNYQLPTFEFNKDWKYKPKKFLGIDFSKDSTYRNMGLATNLLGAGVSAAINARALNRMEAPARPYSVTPAKFKTTININPSLQKLENTANAYSRAIRENTVSSKDRLARLRSTNLERIQGINELNAYKDTTETSLINEDIKNAQDIAKYNLENINNWRENVRAFKNDIRDLRSENIQSAIQTGAQSVVDYGQNFISRNQFDRNLAMTLLAYPDVTNEYMEERWKKLKELGIV